MTVRQRDSRRIADGPTDSDVAAGVPGRRRCRTVKNRRGRGRRRRAPSSPTANIRGEQAVVVVVVCSLGVAGPQ